MKIDKQKTTNRLINATSPYLLQHAHNPVDWYECSNDDRQTLVKNSRQLSATISKLTMAVILLTFLLVAWLPKAQQRIKS